MKVRFAVGPDRDWLSASTLLDFAGAVETAGFDGAWLSEIPLSPTIDPLLGIAFLARRTTRLRLGANVVPLGRNPFVLAKQLAQLDQVSDGRLLLTFVTGVNHLGEREALGITGGTRGELLEQALGIARGFWAGEAVGRISGHFSAFGLRLPIRPVQDPLEDGSAAAAPRLWSGPAGSLTAGSALSSPTPRPAAPASRSSWPRLTSAGRSIASISA